MTVLPTPRSPLDGVSRIATDCRRRGIDLRSDLREARERQTGGIAGAILDDGAVEIHCSGCQLGCVLTGRHRIAEGQRIGARAATIGRGAAVVERQRRGAAGRVDRDRFARGEREGDSLASTEVGTRR